MESGESRDEISLTRSAHQKINTIFQLSIMVRLRIRLWEIFNCTSRIKYIIG
jgi:hypothetical protein